MSDLTPEVVASALSGTSIPVESQQEILKSLYGEGAQSEAEPTVTITVSEYESLKEDRETLLKLENAGVDNWEGYSYAFDGTFD